MWFRRLVIYGLLLAATVFTVGPFVWMAAGSFMTQEQITRPGFAAFVPTEPTLQNYRYLFDAVPFRTYLVNTVFVAAMTASSRRCGATVAFRTTRCGGISRCSTSISTPKTVAVSAPLTRPAGQACSPTW